MRSPIKKSFRSVLIQIIIHSITPLPKEKSSHQKLLYLILMVPFVRSLTTINIMTGRKEPHSRFIRSEQWERFKFFPHAKLQKNNDGITSIRSIFRWSNDEFSLTERTLANVLPRLAIQIWAGARIQNTHYWLHWICTSYPSLEIRIWIGILTSPRYKCVHFIGFGLELAVVCLSLNSNG